MTDMTIKDYQDNTSIDGANDYFLGQQNSTGDYRRYTRNSILGVSGDPVDKDSTQTLSNKTVDNSNTITVKDTNFTLQDDGNTTRQAKFQLSSITAGQTRTYTLPDATGTIADTASAQTLSNKTLTAPVISNATITSDVYSGYSSANSGTIFGIAVTNSKVIATALANMYPIGCIYSETTGVNPATTFGFGTWVAFGAGRVLVGAGTSDATYTAGVTGGESTHILTQAESGLRDHRHQLRSGTATSTNGFDDGTARSNTSLDDNFRTGNIAEVTGTNGSNGYGSTLFNSTTAKGSAHNNLQPYIVIYYWNRTA